MTADRSGRSKLEIQKARPPVKLHVAPTERLREPFLVELRALLDAAFPDDFSDEDWDHSLGGR